jgi:hypothetical protein
MMSVFFVCGVQVREDPARITRMEAGGGLGNRSTSLLGNGRLKGEGKEVSM